MLRPFTVSARGTPSEPRFVERLSNQTITEGLSASLSVQFVGVPQPMISWQKDGQFIAVNSDHFRILTENGRSTLFIESARANDTAWYQCLAVNIKGTATNRAKLIVQGWIFYQFHF